MIIKYVIGADIAKDTIELCLGSIDELQHIELGSTHTLSNNPNGFSKLQDWLQNQSLTTDTPLWFVMEATGVYYEQFAYFLADHHYSIAVLLPNKLKHYRQTLETKSKTDPLDAKAITQFGLERALRPWSVLPEVMRELKTLSREHHTLKRLHTQVKNQLHAKEHAYRPPKTTISRLQQQLRLFEKQLRAVEADLHKLVEKDPELHQKIQQIDDVKSLGFITIVEVVAETNGFALFESAKQLTSFSGLDIVLDQSGSRQGQSHISKKGNAHIRQAMYMAALSAIRCNDVFKALYIRLVQKKRHKKIALIAVARKLLCLIFTLWKKNVPYDFKYHKQHTLCCQ